MRMIAFQKFKEINSFKNEDEKHRAWLKDYEGLYFSIGKNKKDLIKWKEEKEKYIYSDKLWNNWITEDFNSLLNSIHR